MATPDGQVQTWVCCKAESYRFSGVGVNKTRKEKLRGETAVVSGDEVPERDQAEIARVVCLQMERLLVGTRKVKGLAPKELVGCFTKGSPASTGGE